jgi:hypothetical protein
VVLKYPVQHIPARFWGTKQGNNLGRTVTMHTVECPNQPGYAPSLARNWFQSAMDGRPSSATYMVDPTNSVLMVDPTKVAWHCGNGNANGIGIEQAGYTADTRAQWLGDYGVATMLRAADLAAVWMKPRGVPVVWLTPQQTLNGAKGINGHNTMRLAFGGTTHTDPDGGRSDRWPHDVFLKMVEEAIHGYPTQEVDLNAQEVQDATYAAIEKWAKARHGAAPAATLVEALNLYKADLTFPLDKVLDTVTAISDGGQEFSTRLTALEEKVDAILAAVKPSTPESA